MTLSRYTFYLKTLTRWKEASKLDPSKYCPPDSDFERLKVAYERGLCENNT
jgi:hypothetical protein